MESLVTTEWLASELDATDLRVVDATKFLPAMNRDARAEYETDHISGAIFLDLGELVDHHSPIENMLPNAEKFASRMQSLGIGDGSRIVLYDNSPLISAARAWFMLKVFGAQQVALLNGGMAKWKAEGRPTDGIAVKRRERHFTQWRDASHVRNKSDMMANIVTGSEQVIDARPAGRFTGEDVDPRGGAAGHIPGSRNLPHAHLLTDQGIWKQGEELRKAFVDAGIDPDKPVVTTCGSGMTAAVLNFGLHLLGNDNAALYDGSWAEWGFDPETPKALGSD